MVVISFVEDRVSRSRSNNWRRLLKLVFADPTPHIMIRRELPLTITASPAGPASRASLKRRFPTVSINPAAFGAGPGMDKAAVTVFYGPCRSIPGQSHLSIE